MKQKIRLPDYAIEAITSLFVRHFLPNDHLWIFGSRIDLSKKGGDIDLYIETHTTNIDDIVKMKGDFIWDLEQAIGEQKIDVVLNMIDSECKLPIYEIAKTKGVKIV